MPSKFSQGSLPDATEENEKALLRDRLDGVLHPTDSHDESRLSTMETLRRVVGSAGWTSRSPEYLPVDNGEDPTRTEKAPSKRLWNISSWPRTRVIVIAVIVILVLPALYAYSGLSNVRDESSASLPTVPRPPPGTPPNSSHDSQPPKEDTDEPESLQPPKEDTDKPGSFITEPTAPASDVETREQRLFIVLPIDGPGPDLCKTIFSAVSMGYPTPVIVNWRRDFQKITGYGGGQHLTKIVGLMEYLDVMMRDDAHEDDRIHEEDIVIMTDAYDSWFQLPPEVLLHRFHESNRKADLRLRDQWGDDSEMPMRQRVVVSSQKRCWPTAKNGATMHCNALPESPLRHDLYGPKTDKGSNGYHNNRPKYLNSGSMMGYAGDFKRYAHRVNNRMEEGLSTGFHLSSDQGVFAEIWAEQELWRTWKRERHAAAIKTGVSGDAEEATLMINDNFEYHVGLDYSQDLFIPTVFEEEDGEIITLNNATEIEKYSADLKIDPVRLTGVPGDMLHVKNPLADLSPKMTNADLDWGEMPLYADFFTTAVPAVVHHNAHKDNLKQRRVWWWDRMWYFPYLRELLAVHLVPASRQALGQIPNEDGSVTVYYAQTSDERTRKPRLFEPSMAGSQESLPGMEYDQVCRYDDETDDDGSDKHWYKEIFRDDLGTLVVPGM